MAKWIVSVKRDSSIRNVTVEAEAESTACMIAIDQVRNLPSERNQNKQISVHSIKKLN